MIDIKRERRILLFIFLCLTLFGLLIVYETSSLYAYKRYGDYLYFFKKQLVFFILGLILFSLTLLVNLNFLRKYSKEFLVISIFILIFLLFFGKKIGGAKRWLSFLGFNFQPSELLKIFFLFYCVDYISRKGPSIRDFKKLIPLGFILGFICILLLLQPDLGSVIFWILWLILFLFLHRAKKRHLIFVVVFGVLISFFLIRTHPYRFRRISAYLSPFTDPLDTGYQIVQSQIAYIEGGLLGRGLGESRQKLFFLPAAHTDFIFSIIAEEFGLLGSLGFIFLFFIIFNKMVNIAKLIEDRFRRGILWGIILILFLEVIINIGVSCGVFPTKGLPLPFVSYGGSNLVIHYILLGIFFNSSRV